MSEEAFHTPEELFKADPYGFIVRALHGETLYISMEVYRKIVEELYQHIEEKQDG